MERRDGIPAMLRRAGAGLCTGALVLAALPAAAQGQMYKWKDAAGTVHYSDMPPPGPQGGQTRVLRSDGAAPSAPALPYELARAAQNHPVTLYTTARCDACDQGRSLLAARGIPFAEKTVNTAQDQQQLRSIGGKDELPLLVVGKRQVAGFQAAAWNGALDEASYPRKTMLPPGYRNGAAAPAAPAAAASLPAPPARSAETPAPDEAAARARQQQPRQQAEPKKPASDFRF